MFSRVLVALMLPALVAGGCTSSRQTDPPRTATEQLLISSAADRAAANLVLGVPAGTRVFVDATNFEGVDGRYAVGAIRDHLLRQGLLLVPERRQADAVVEIRSGALSIDNHESLVGIPRFNVPIPLTGDFTFPEISLYKQSQRRAIAKFAAVGYDAKSGRLLGSTDAQYGFSHRTRWTVLLFISWMRTDAIPHEKEYSPLDIEPPELP